MRYEVLVQTVGGQFETLVAVADTKAEARSAIVEHMKDRLFAVIGVSAKPCAYMSTDYRCTPSCKKTLNSTGDFGEPAGPMSCTWPKCMFTSSYKGGSGVVRPAVPTRSVMIPRGTESSAKHPFCGKEVQYVRRLRTGVFCIIGGHYFVCTNFENVVQQNKFMCLPASRAKLSKIFGSRVKHAMDTPGGLQCIAADLIWQEVRPFDIRKGIKPSIDSVKKIDITEEAYIYYTVEALKLSKREQCTECSSANNAMCCGGEHMEPCPTWQIRVRAYNVSHELEENPCSLCNMVDNCPKQLRLGYGTAEVVNKEGINMKRN